MIIYRKAMLILMVGGAALLSGCATMATRLGSTPPYDHFYMATKLDIGLYRDVWRGDDFFRGGTTSFLLWAPLITIDLPVSLVTDTVFLPCDGYRYAMLDLPDTTNVARFTVNKLAGNWVLLDHKPVPVSVVEAPLFDSTNALISLITNGVEGSIERGFTLLVAAVPQVGSYHRLAKSRTGDTGMWYYSDELKREFWISRELFRQYRREPEVIYLGVEMTVLNKVSEDAARKLANLQR